jgi:hypothetical protein
VETLYQLHKECAKSSSCSRVKTQEGYMVFFLVYDNPISEYNWWNIMPNIIVI